MVKSRFVSASTCYTFSFYENVVTYCSKLKNFQLRSTRKIILLRVLDNYSLIWEKNFFKKQTFRKNATSCRLIETVFLTVTNICDMPWVSLQKRTLHIVIRYWIWYRYSTLPLQNKQKIIEKFEGKKRKGFTRNSKN